MCTINITINGSVSDFLDRAKQQVEGHQGEFDVDAGTFDVSTPLGHISGDITTTGNDITIDVRHKPFLIGCGAIEDYVKAHLN